jgi:hypothetical protein
VLLYIRNAIAQDWDDHTYSAGEYQSTIVRVERSGVFPNRRPSAPGKRTRALKFGFFELDEQPE